MLLVECFLAVREESRSYLWGGLLLVDGVQTFATARIVGRGPQCSISATQHEGARQLLRRLQTMRAQVPFAKFLMLSDSRELIRQMRGELSYESTEAARLVQEEIRAFDQAQKEIGAFDRMLTLCYVPRSRNAAAHRLITELCVKHGLLQRGAEA